MENRAPSWDSLHALIDLCAGFGVLSQGIAAGFEVAVPRMMELYAKVSDAPQLRGDFGNQEFCMRFGRKQVGHQPFHPDLAVSRTHAWVMGKVAMTSGPIAYPKHWQQRFSSRPNWLSWSVWHPQVRMDLSKPSWNISCARRASVVPRLNCDLIMHGRVVGTKRTGPHRHVNMAGFEKHH